MELVLETLMCVMFDGAMGFLILRSLQCARTGKRRCRIADGIFALGFLLGLAAKCLAGGSWIVLTLLVLGFMLSYTAFVLTFPEKRKHGEGR